jgi:Nucleotidyltransferase of unknown function (DUF6036)
VTEQRLTAELLRIAFGKLSLVLARENLTADVFVFGGAAMVLGYDARPATRDVDAVWRPHSGVLNAVWEVAADLHLQRSWLNEQASFYLPPNVTWVGPTLFESDSLRVIQASPELLLAMKVRAARQVDLSDVRVLADRLGLESLISLRTRRTCGTCRRTACSCWHHIGKTQRGRHGQVLRRLNQ